MSTTRCSFFDSSKILKRCFIQRGAALALLRDSVNYLYDCHVERSETSLNPFSVLRRIELIKGSRVLRSIFSRTELDL